MFEVILYKFVRNSRFIYLIGDFDFKRTHYEKCKVGQLCGLAVTLNYLHSGYCDCLSRIEKNGLFDEIVPEKVSILFQLKRSGN